jgi:hypothetical protein
MFGRMSDSGALGGVVKRANRASCQVIALERLAVQTQLRT